MKYLFSLMTIQVLCLMPAVVSAQETLNNPLTKNNEILSVTALVGRIIQAVLGIAGLLAVLFIMIGGVQIISARGNSSGFEKGRDTLVWAVIGTVIAFGGFVIVGFVIERAQQLLP